MLVSRTFKQPEEAKNDISAYLSSLQKEQDHYESKLRNLKDKIVGLNQFNQKQSSLNVTSIDEAKEKHLPIEIQPKDSVRSRLLDRPQDHMFQLTG